MRELNLSVWKNNICLWNESYSQYVKDQTHEFEVSDLYHSRWLQIDPPSGVTYFRFGSIPFQIIQTYTLYSAFQYLVVYTTEYDDTYVLETILSDDMNVFKEEVRGHQERQVETELEEKDEDAGMTISQRLVKVRKLDRAIGANLKLLYGYRCQICGCQIGSEYGTHIAEAHHIDYFVRSLNNDANNQMIVCPNHHSIIHELDPVFDRKRLMYVFQNGVETKLVLNQHLKATG